MKKAPPLSKCNNPEFSSKNRRKRQKIFSGWAYGIERLPDEILIVILSYLTLKEAARTSVLSHRWRYLWRFTSGSLDFDNFLRSKKSNGIEIDEQQPAVQFDTLVNRILKLHQSPSVDKFIVRCPMLAHSDCVTNWVRFAMQKDVRVFELTLRFHNDFPDLNKFLSISRALKLKDINVFSSLKSFTLNKLNIKDLMIEFLLSNCPHLQHLYLRGLHGLTNLNINVGSSLKSLIIYYCSPLENLMISAPNLVSFEYGGFIDLKSHAVFENAPLLSELTLHGDCCRDLLDSPYFPCGISKYSNQLGKLVLHVPLLMTVVPSGYINDRRRGAFLQLKCLKHLELVLDTVDYANLLPFALLTKACPFLSMFVVQFIYVAREYNEEMKVAGLRSYRSKHAQEVLKLHRHEHLKVVKLINMAFYRTEFRFALSLLQIANKSLEKIIIKPGRGIFGSERIATAQERVKQLKANLPPAAELIIL